MKNLKKYRKKRGIKQYEIAKYLKISESAYSHYENGQRNIPNDTFIKICDFFDISADYLLGLIDEPISLSECKKARDIIKQAKEKSQPKKLVESIDPDKAVNKLKEIIRVLLDE